MQRRHFLIFSSLLGLANGLKAETQTPFERSFQKVKPTIAMVQAHMFPKGSRLPSAEERDTILFLFETVAHKSYDRDIRAFVIAGAVELENRLSAPFATLTFQEKEKALRAFEETAYGSNWLSRIMTLTMEGLFSAPVYGPNQNETGWKALKAYGGSPRPKTRYIS